jgi:hypothetical protein
VNVFVLSTGRAGSTTIARACGHFDGWTAGHETRSRELGKKRFDYAPNHVESDNRLTWVLGRLFERFGEDAMYVHLQRDPEEVAVSYNQRWSHDGAILPAYRAAILMTTQPPKIRPGTPEGLMFARDYVSTANANIAEFVRHRANTFSLDLEDLVEQFPAFMDRIGAEGQWADIHYELVTRYNDGPPSFPRPRHQFRKRVKYLLRR